MTRMPVRRTPRQRRAPSLWEYSPDEGSRKKWVKEAAKWFDFGVYLVPDQELQYIVRTYCAVRWGSNGMVMWEGARCSVLEHALEEPGNRAAMHTVWQLGNADRLLDWLWRLDNDLGFEQDVP